MGWCTGVIVAVDQATTQEQADRITQLLAERFPGVTVAVVGGGSSSIAFQFLNPQEGDR